MARFTAGISPVALAMDYFEWLSHLAASPGKQLQLAEKAVRKGSRFGLYATASMIDPETRCCIDPLPQDHRFTHEAWQRFPYNLASTPILGRPKPRFVKGRGGLSGRRGW